MREVYDFSEAVRRDDISGKTEMKVSKLLSYILRHNPQEFGLTLDKEGFVDVDKLLESIRKKGPKRLKGIDLTKELLDQVVAKNVKQRFAYNTDGTKIRANQGHSVEVDIKYPVVEPPEFLYHGSATQNVDAIMKGGIQSMTRLHVHMGDNVEKARSVGARHGTPVVFKIHANSMHHDGIEFYLTANKVWLTNFVPSKYIELLPKEKL